MECLHLVTLAQVVEAVQPMLAAHVVSR